MDQLLIKPESPFIIPQLTVKELDSFIDLKDVTDLINNHRNSIFNIDHNAIYFAMKKKYGKAATWLIYLLFFSFYFMIFQTILAAIFVYIDLKFPIAASLLSLPISLFILYVTFSEVIPNSVKSKFIKLYSERDNDNETDIKKGFLCGSDTKFFVAIYNDKELEKEVIIGAATVTKYESVEKENNFLQLDSSKNIAELKIFTVINGYRNLNVESKLMNTIFDYCQRSKYDELIVTALCNNADTIKTYKKNNMNKIKYVEDSKLTGFGRVILHKDLNSSNLIEINV